MTEDLLRPEEAADVPRSKLTARYTFKQSLGKGGFGEVWLATDNATGAQVAVKVLSLKQLPRAMVEQEVTAMRRVDRHPNVVALLDVIWVAPDSERCCSRPPRAPGRAVLRELRHRSSSPSHILLGLLP